MATFALIMALLLAVPALPGLEGALSAQERGDHDHGHGETQEHAGGHQHGEAHDHSEDGGNAEDGHHEGLHFTHPLFTESVSPDRKLRLDYGYFDLPGDGDQEHSARVGFEWALSRAFSVEASFPYTFTEGATGVTEVKLKFANYALEDHGVLLGYGVGAGIPTAGDGPAAEHHPDEEDHAHPAAAARIPDPAVDGGSGAVVTTLGRDHWELSPFFNLGYRSGAWELVGFGTLGIPTNEVSEEEHGVSISYNASALYHAGSRLDLLAEIHGSGGVQGHPVGEDVVNLAPGIRWRVLPDQPLVVGIGASFPLSDAENYDSRVLASLFYHFGG